jgi:DNA-binding transcriptional ArsR family regulator
MRGALGEAAEIIRDDGRVAIVVRRPLAVEDPRCQEPLADRVLDRLAASNGRATAKELTAALRVPLRTVQRALGQLVDEGACHAEPDGRKTEYVVEDTTFNEPSLHRLRGQRD